MLSAAKHLAVLKEACRSGDRTRILAELETLLEWLAVPENNTDRNCRAVDAFVCSEVQPLLPESVPAEIRELLFDVGGQLHDTHRATELAEQFASIPQQLLARTRQLMGDRA